MILFLYSSFLFFQTAPLDDSFTRLTLAGSKHRRRVTQPVQLFHFDSFKAVHIPPVRSSANNHHAASETTMRTRTRSFFSHLFLP